MSGLDRVKARRVVLAHADLGLVPEVYVETVLDRLETCVVEDVRLTRVKAVIAGPAVDLQGVAWVRKDHLDAALSDQTRSLWDLVKDDR